MANVSDVVTLSGGSVGVVSELTSRGLFRVRFPDGTNIETSDEDITETLDAPTFADAVPVSVWPDAGILVSSTSSEAVVDLDKVEALSSGVLRWTARITVPFWRLILDNDPRLQRSY